MENANIAREIKDLHRLIRCRLNGLTGKPENFNYTKFQIIMYLLKRQGETVHQKDIVSELGLKKSSVAECLDVMEADDEIKRVTDSEDRRKKVVLLTEKSLKRKEAIDEAVTSLNEEILKNLTDDEVKTFMNICGKIRKNMEGE